MNNKYVCLAYASVWFAMAIVVCVAIYFTRNGGWLLGMLLPACIHIKTINKEDNV